MRRLLLGGVLAACAASARAQTPVFEAAVASVYVDVFVVHDGRPVQGLTAADFQLRDEGVVTPAELVGSDRAPLVAVLAFDTSGSLAGERLRLLQDAGLTFLEALLPVDEVGLVTFSDEVASLVPPSADKGRVARALATLRPRGGTALYDGLLAAATLPSSPARSLVVAFSDGEDRSSWTDARMLRAALDRSNALLHVVGIVPTDGPVAQRRRFPADALDAERPAMSGGLRPAVFVTEAHHRRLLRELAESTGGQFWPAESPDRVRAAFAGVAEAMRHRYILRFEPPAGAKPGWRRLEVKLRRGRGTGSARPGYWAHGGASGTE